MAVRIVVLDGYTLNPGDNPFTAVAALGDLTVHDRTPPELILERAAGAQILLTNKTPLTRETLAALPDLRFVSVLATGYNIVDTAAAREQGVTVSNVPAYSTDFVAQHVFALLLELCHHVGLHSDLVHAGEWSRSADFCFWRTPLVELAGLRFGIVGFGRIGRRVGELAHAFGMDVVAHAPRPGAAPGYEPFAYVELDELFATADVVSLHCPLTASTTGLVDAARLATMKPGSYLLNTARGPLVNEADLAAALAAGRPRAAAVDVVSSEPIAPNNPLLGASNCLITPHLAWAGLAARRRLMQVTADNVAAYLAGQPNHVVNGQA